MNREEQPFYYLLILIVKTIAFVVVGGVILIILFLLYLSMNNPNNRQALVNPYHDIVIKKTLSEVYLRNQTDSVLFLLLKVPRSSLQIDTIWWGVEVAPEAIGRAVAATAPYISLGDTVYPLTAPIVVQGTGDTLVADKPIDLPATGQVSKRKLFYPHRNLPLWKERVRHFKPVFEPTMVIKSFSGQPDSVVLIVQVTSSGTFLLAREERSTMKTVELEDMNDNGLMDTVVHRKNTSFALLPTVQWTDSLHHSHKRHITWTDIKKARSTRFFRDSTDHTNRIYYLDYR